MSPIRDPIKIKVGMPSDPKEISIEVPEGDPTPWQLGDQHAIVGKPHAASRRRRESHRPREVHVRHQPAGDALREVRDARPTRARQVKSVDVAEAAQARGRQGREGSRRPKEVRYAGRTGRGRRRDDASDRRRGGPARQGGRTRSLPHAARHEQALADGAPQVLANRPNRVAGRRNQTLPPPRRRSRRGPEGAPRTS